jgi:hypothetical protein
VGVTTSLLRSPAWVFRVFEAWSCRSAAAPRVSALLPAAESNPTASGVGLAGGPPARRSDIRPRTWPRPCLPTARQKTTPGAYRGGCLREGKSEGTRGWLADETLPHEARSPLEWILEGSRSGRPSPGCGPARGVGAGARRARAPDVAGRPEARGFPETEGGPGRNAPALRWLDRRAARLSTSYVRISVASRSQSTRRRRRDPRRLRRG